MSGFRARTGRGVLVAAVALVGVVAPAGVARAGDRRSISGTSSASGAPSLRSGISSDTLDPGGGRYYTFTLAEGVNAYLKARAHGHTDQLTITLYTSSGARCGSDSGDGEAGAWLEPVVGDGNVRWSSTWTADSGCGRPGRYALEVARTSDRSSGAIPLDLYFLAERPVRSAGGLPGPADKSEKAPPADTTLSARQVDGAEREGDAPRLSGDQGVISASIGPARTVYWRLPTVGWNQRISYTLQFNTTSTSAQVTVGVDDMLATGISSVSRYHFGRDQQTVSGSTVRIRYRNRESDDTEIYHAAWAGPYYLYVSTSSSSGTVTAHLAYSITGSVEGAPKYASARDATTAEAAFDGDDPTLLGMPRMPFAVTAGLLCLAAAAGLAFWPWLVRRVRRQPVNAR